MVAAVIACILGVSWCRLRPERGRLGTLEQREVPLQAGERSAQRRTDPVPGGDSQRGGVTRVGWSDSPAFRRVCTAPYLSSAHAEACHDFLKESVPHELCAREGVALAGRTEAVDAIGNVLVLLRLSMSSAESDGIVLEIIDDASQSARSRRIALELLVSEIELVGEGKEHTEYVLRWGCDRELPDAVRRKLETLLCNELTPIEFLPVLSRSIPAIFSGGVADQRLVPYWKLLSTDHARLVAALGGLSGLSSSERVKFWHAWPDPAHTLVIPGAMIEPSVIALLRDRGVLEQIAPQQRVHVASVLGTCLDAALRTTSLIPIPPPEESWTSSGKAGHRLHLIKNSEGGVMAPEVLLLLMTYLLYVGESEASELDLQILYRAARHPAIDVREVLADDLGAVHQPWAVRILIELRDNSQGSRMVEDAVRRSARSLSDSGVPGASDLLRVLEGE